MKSSSAQGGSHRLASLYADVEESGRTGRIGKIPQLQRLRPEHHAVCALTQEEIDRAGRSAA
jgi:hypothetical protein